MKKVQGTVRVHATHPRTVGLVKTCETYVEESRTACKNNGDAFIEGLKLAGYTIVRHWMEYKDVETKE